jgi:hypothetical protein
MARISGAPSLGEGKWQVSKDGGSEAMWRANGKEIIFQAPPNRTTKMAVEVKTNGAALEADIPKKLFQTSVDSGWDVTPDGKRFLLSAPGPAGRPGPHHGGAQLARSIKEVTL